MYYLIIVYLYTIFTIYNLDIDTVNKNDVRSQDIYYISNLLFIANVAFLAEFIQKFTNHTSTVEELINFSTDPEDIMALKDKCVDIFVDNKVIEIFTELSKKLIRILFIIFILYLIMSMWNSAKYYIYDSSKNSILSEKEEGDKVTYTPFSIGKILLPISICIFSFIP